VRFNTLFWAAAPRTGVSVPVKPVAAWISEAPPPPVPKVMAIVPAPEVFEVRTILPPLSLAVTPIPAVVLIVFSISAAVVSPEVRLTVTADPVPTEMVIVSPARPPELLVKAFAAVYFVYVAAVPKP
jgi:hypothetical protein